MWHELTKNFPDHENEADDGGHIQPLPGRLLLTLSILLRVAVIMAVLDASDAVHLRHLVVDNTAKHIKIFIVLLLT